MARFGPYVDTRTVTRTGSSTRADPLTSRTASGCGSSSHPNCTGWRQGERVRVSLPQKRKIQAGLFSITERRRCRLLSPFHHLTIEYAILQSAEDTLPTFDLKAYARRGAEARIAELTAELNDIHKAFPDLRRGATTPSATTRGSAGGGRRKRKPMSAAQRKAVGQRMKAYWAARKAKKGR
jgi:hypothetical protein